jgi:ABC-type glycerol-3-phosphate transport system permease component
MVGDVLRELRRALLLGQLRARSYDLQEDQLIAPDKVAATWQVTGPATVVQIADAREPHAELQYDFSKGNKLELSQTFKTSFPVERLYRVQLYLRNDDTWHPLIVYVEKLGKRYRAERPWDLADFSSWAIGTWQEPGPDDKTNKIRSWKLLREVGPSPVTGPNELKITLEIDRNTPLGAWWAKIRRNYGFALEHIPFWRYVATSLFVVILNLVGTLLSCSLVAYSFARLQWPGRNFCFALMLATMMVPGQVTMIPYFLIVRSLGWYNTLYPLWFGSFFAGAFNVFLLRQFLKGIPRDLEDAAKIDGCGFWRIYWHIMLPLIKPTLAAIGIFTFMGAWNEFMGPLIYLQDQRLYPLALGLYAFNVESGGSMGMMMAGSLLMTVPVIVIFFFAQKYFIQGVTLTGMKG